jgi:GT2 family glycosyltransferase
MKHIALFCVSYESDKELDYYRQSLNKAVEKAKGKICLDFFVAHNSRGNNPGYFGAIKRLMADVDIKEYDYTIISNVDLTVEEDFFLKLADYTCDENIGWIAPQIWSNLEKRDRNPKILERYSQRKLNILKLFYQFPILETLYTHTIYRQKKFESHPAGRIYAGHGSFIILTREYFKRCGKIDYPIFLFCEEIYLAEMCQKAGLYVKYEPTIKIIDTELISTGKMKHSHYCRCNYEAMQYIIKSFY